MDISSPFPPAEDRRDPLASAFVNRQEELERLITWLDSRQPSPVLITGGSGVGKTALISFFVERHFSEQNVYWLHLYENSIAAEEFRGLHEALSIRESTENCVVVIENAENAQQQVISVHVTNLRQRYPDLRVIIISRSRIAIEPVNRIDLDTFGLEHSVSLLETFLIDRQDDATLETLFEMTGGHPLALQLLGRYLTSRATDDLDALLGFSAYGPLEATNEDQANELIQVVEPQILIANDYLIERLRKAPQDIHQLSPRRFEELVAELLAGLGWEVQLTKVTHDGGSDILAFMNTEVGKLLTLVEAKKFNPERPVGVSLVRELYGTLVDFQANSALLVTTSRFTRHARQFEQKHEYQVSLKDYFNLLDWIGAYGRNQRSPTRADSATVSSA